MILRLFFLLFPCFLFAQKNYHLAVIPSFEGEKLRLEKNYYLADIGDSVKLETFSFYLSNLEFLQQGKVVFAEPESYHLLTMEDSSSWIWEVKLPSNLVFDSLKFCLGIDSATQSAGARGGDLDPTTGMYWTWQSGYIHAKIEGKSPVIATHQHLFQLHLGGYRPPFNTIQTLSFPTKNEEKMSLGISLDTFLNAAKLGSHPEIMSPGAAAVQLSRFLRDSFEIIQN